MQKIDNNQSLARYAKEELHRIQEALDIELKTYLDAEHAKITKNFPEIASVSMNSYMDIITRGGKRLRGAFVLKGHDLFGGDLPLAELIKAAIAIEMIHAFLLVFDDVADMSEVRRGTPSAHKMMEIFHREKALKGDISHYSEMFAIHAACAGQFMASNLLLSLKLPSDILTKALKSVNSTIINTAYGQLHDIYNAVAKDITEEDVINVHTYKTAFYTYQNPLQLGAILAGATDNELKLLENYAIPAGIAFQLQDDILGVYGDTDTTGKSAFDDLAEGKMTLLTQYARAHCTDSDQRLLDEVLGNRSITTEQHEAVKALLHRCGAYKYNKEMSIKFVKEAKFNLNRDFPEKRDNEAFRFMTGVADYMIERDL